MTCNNVPEICYRHVCRHDLRCLAVSTRNRLGDGSFEGGLDGIWTGISWMLRVLVETVKYRLWIALFSTRALDSRPNSSCLGQFGLSTICTRPWSICLRFGRIWRGLDDIRYLLMTQQHVLYQWLGWFHNTMEYSSLIIKSIKAASMLGRFIQQLALVTRWGSRCVDIYYHHFRVVRWWVMCS